MRPQQMKQIKLSSIVVGSSVDVFSSMRRCYCI